MFPQYLRLLAVAAVILGQVILRQATPLVVASDHEEQITIKSQIKNVFNQQNPVGQVDFAEVFSDLDRPANCQAPLVICTINTVAFDISIEALWDVRSIPDLSSQEFAEAIGEQEQPVAIGKRDLPAFDVLRIQETLARRGLLVDLEGEVIDDRGFFGPLTNLALIRLAHIKGLDPQHDGFSTQLSDEINRLISKYETDKEYLQKHPLPAAEEMTPQPGDPLYLLWKQQLEKARLSQSAERVEPGEIAPGRNLGVEVDGTVNVQFD